LPQASEAEFTIIWDVINSPSLIILASLLFLMSCKEKPSEFGYFIPLYDLGTGTFQGFEGGLYPEGENRTPEAHSTVIATRLAQLQPMDVSGNPTPDGAIVLLGLGYSTAAMTTNAAAALLEKDCPDSRIKMVSAAQGGMDINAMTDTNTAYWSNALSAIQAAGYSTEQVQLIWLSTADMQANNKAFPEHALSQLEKYKRVLQLIQDHFPHLQVVWISDRAYGGYITSDQAAPLREPGAYYTSWAVKWVIEQQILLQPGFRYGEIPAIDWGPTLWTNGIKGDSKGYTWNPSDAGEGGIHPTEAGKWKEGERLYQFLGSSCGLSPWLCHSTSE
jgi:hypothetical protein